MIHRDALPLDQSEFLSLNSHSCRITLYHTIPTFNDLKKNPLENIMGKGENAGNQHFLLFP